MARSKQTDPSKRLRRVMSASSLSGDRVKNAAGEIDESPAAVHERDALLVFTAEHPRPAHAVLDAEQIIAQLDR